MKARCLVDPASLAVMAFRSELNRQHHQHKRFLRSLLRHQTWEPKELILTSQFGIVIMEFIALWRHTKLKMVKSRHVASSHRTSTGHRLRQTKYINNRFFLVSDHYLSLKFWYYCSTLLVTCHTRTYKKHQHQLFWRLRIMVGVR